MTARPPATHTRRRRFLPEHLPRLSHADYHGVSFAAGHAMMAEKYIVRRMSTRADDVISFRCRASTEKSQLYASISPADSAAADADSRYSRYHGLAVKYDTAASQRHFSGRVCAHWQSSSTSVWPPAQSGRGSADDSADLRIFSA